MSIEDIKVNSLAQNGGMPHRSQIWEFYNVEQLESIVNKLVGGIKICEYAKDVPVIYVSDGYLNLFGYTYSEFIDVQGGYHAGLICDEDKKTINSKIKQFVDTNGKFNVEYQAFRKDNTLIWVLEKGILVKLPDGRSVLQSVLTDISDYKAVEAELAVSEQRYDIAMEFSDVTVFDYNIITKRMIHHHSDLNIYDVPKIMDNAVETMISSGMIQPDSVGTFRKLYYDIENGAPSVKAVINSKNSSGVRNVVEIQLNTIFDNAGKPVRAVGIKRDITEIVSLQHEREYGSTLILNKRLSYEANVTKDIITTYDPVWSNDIGIPKVISLSETIALIAAKAVMPEYRNMYIHKSSSEYIISEFESGKRLISFEYQKIQKDHTIQWIEKTINIIKDEITGDINIRSYIENITDRKEKDIRLAADKKHYDAILAKSAEIYEINFTQNRFISGFELWSEEYGISNTGDYKQMVMMFCNKAVYGEDRDVFKSCFLTQNALCAQVNGKKEIVIDYRKCCNTGELIWFRCIMYLFKDSVTGDVGGFAYIQNVNDEKLKELDLIYKSQHDMLTGLYNKVTVEEKVNDYLATSEGQLSKHAFFIIDIDYFKKINDNFGHAFGDAVLSQVAQKIRSLFRDDDIFGRIGGDEFVILMKNIQDNKTAMLKAEEICKNILETYMKSGVEIEISSSIGIAFANADGTSYEDIYTHSDTAMYQAKQNGRNTFFVYSSDMVASTSTVKAIDSNRLIDIKKFDENISEYVFRILYEAKDKESAINSVLELIGKHYKISRAYVFEVSDDTKYINNTFEWCNKDIMHQIDQMQNILCSEMGWYQRHFNDDGIFYSTVSDLEAESERIIFSNQDIKTIFQFSIQKDGLFDGFVGFDQCDYERELTRSEISDFRNIANILCVFITEMRAFERIKASEESILSIVNGLDSYAYVCSPVTYEMMFINDKTKMAIPNAQVGKLCYESLWNREAPCEVCVMRYMIENSVDKWNMISYNPTFNVRSKVMASWIDWINDKKQCLINIIDITE